MTVVGVEYCLTIRGAHQCNVISAPLLSSLSTRDISPTSDADARPRAHKADDAIKCTVIDEGEVQCLTVVDHSQQNVSVLF